MNKRHYWINMQPYFFFQPDSTYILAQKNGEAIMVLYLWLLAKSASTNGMLRVTEDLPYTPKTLAAASGISEDVVTRGFEAFSTMSLVKILDDGTIFMKRHKELVRSETASARRMRRRRKALAEKAKKDGETEISPYREADGCFYESYFEPEEATQCDAKKISCKKVTPLTAETGDVESKVFSQSEAENHQNYDGFCKPSATHCDGETERESEGCFCEPYFEAEGKRECGSRKTSRKGAPSTVKKSGVESKVFSQSEAKNHQHDDCFCTPTASHCDGDIEIDIEIELEKEKEIEKEKEKKAASRRPQKKRNAPSESGGTEAAENGTGTEAYPSRRLRYVIRSRGEAAAKEGKRIVRYRHYRLRRLVHQTLSR